MIWGFEMAAKVGTPTRPREEISPRAHDSIKVIDATLRLRRVSAGSMLRKARVSRSLWYKFARGFSIPSVRHVERMMKVLGGRVRYELT